MMQLEYIKQLLKCVLTISGIMKKNHLGISLKKKKEKSYLTTAPTFKILIAAYATRSYMLTCFPDCIW